MIQKSLGNVGGHHRHSTTTTTTTTTTRKNTTRSPLPAPHSPPPFSDGGGGGSDDEFPRIDERFPPWTNQETRDFIEITARLEWDFTISKSNNNLWEMVANRMMEKGYRRTIDHCKCKWGSLVDRYKEQETSDVGNSQQCPFYNELHALFEARDNRMQQVMKGRKRPENVSGDPSQEEEREEEEETGLNQAGRGTVAPERKAADRKKMQKTGQSEKHLRQLLENVSNNGSVLASVQEVFGNFMQQQERINMLWKESVEKLAQERELFAQEWQQRMEKLEKEKMVMEQAWSEKEEQRRLRQERRAEKRDALLTTLVNKLIRDENS